MQSFSINAMVAADRRREMVARSRSAELVRQARSAGAPAAPLRTPLRVSAGWWLVDAGLRLAVSGHPAVRRQAG